MDILQLPHLVEYLPKGPRAIFDRIYDFSVNKGELQLPDKVKEWAETKIGECEEQSITRVTNKITYEGTLFNGLRSKRPFDTTTEEEIEKIIEETRGGNFCHPETHTPEDSFGRVKGKHCITGSNIAKYDYLHGVVIFNEHHPFVYQEEKIADYVETAMRWFEKANEYDGRAIYPFFMWNCLWRAAASIVHGHAQVLISDQPYSAVEFLKSVNTSYYKRYGNGYFEDLYAVHEALGLGVQVNGVRIMANLTPIKEKELMMITSDMNNLPYCISRALECYYQWGVRSFNLVIYMPPLIPQSGWENFPYVVRLVDRGDPMNRTTDIGGMELYAGHSVVSSDPFKVFEELRPHMIR